MKKHKRSGLKKIALSLLLSTILESDASAMKRLLWITASPDLSSSSSRRLSKGFIDSLMGRYPNQYSVTHRDLEKSPPTVVRSNTLEVIAGQVTSEDSKRLKSISSQLIDEVKTADAIVLATPMHNFTVPATLKAYIDLLLMPGETFGYTSNGPEGKVSDRPVMLVCTSGGQYFDTGRDFLVPYLRATFDFIGIRDVDTVCAGGLAIQNIRENSLQNASSELEQKVSPFHKKLNN